MTHSTIARQHIAAALSDRAMLEMVLSIMPTPPHVSKELLLDICEKTIDVASDRYIDILLEHFSIEEICFSIELMQHPLMRSMMKKTPAAWVALQKLNAELQPEIMPMVAEMMGIAHQTSLH